MISDTRKKTNRLANENFWIISEGRNIDGELCGFEEVPDEGTLKEYEISDIARYLLNPGSIEIKKRLIGCEIHYRKPGLTRIKEGFSRIFPQKIRRWINANSRSPEVLVSNTKLKIPYMNNRDLETHLISIYEHLRSYDVVIKRLPHLNVRKIEHEDQMTTYATVYIPNNKRSLFFNKIEAYLTQETEKGLILHFPKIIMLVRGV